MHGAPFFALARNWQEGKDLPSAPPVLYFIMHLCRLTGRGTKRSKKQGVKALP